MKKLPIDFTGKGTVKGFKFSQLRASEHAYIYRVDTGNMIVYEVFKKRVNRRLDAVQYPNTSDFGIWAWLYLTREFAELKYAKLNEDGKKK